MKKKQLFIPVVLCLPLVGGCALFNGADQKAAALSPRAIANSEQAEPLYQLGRYYQGQKRYAQAIAAYSQALQVDQHFSRARNGLGVVLSQQGQYEEAIQAFELAIRDSPQDAYIYSNLGYAYYLKGLNPQAVATLKQALALDPGNVRARTNLALAYAKMDQSPDPVKTLAAAPVVQHVLAAEARQAVPVAVAIAPAVPQQAAPIVVVERTPTPLPVVESRFEVAQIGAGVFELKPIVAVLPIQDAIAREIHQAMTQPPSEVARVEISNGNGVNGMAKAVRGFLRDKGFRANRLTNQTAFDRKVTLVEYRAGFLVAAEKLRATLPGSVQLVEAKDLRKDISLRVVLGRDLARSAAFFAPDAEKTRLARAGQTS